MARKLLQPTLKNAAAASAFTGKMMGSDLELSVITPITCKMRRAMRRRVHGGKGSGAPEGNRNAWKHGGRSAATLAAARYMRELAGMPWNND